jgi:RNA polymerase sigma factor (sigma-70 family)
MDDAVALGTAVHPRLSGQALRILTDEKLAALAAAGNDDAFGTLYARHHQAVYRYCFSLLHQEADARDALQGSMLAALSSLRAKPIEGDLKPWLFRIAHNQSISIIRGRDREAPTEAPSTAAVTDDPETREQLRTLVSDLTALPDRQRGAIVMREMSGLSYSEIGAALGTSAAAGKQLVYEARSALLDLRDGHEMSCELVRERISARDRRLLRGRKVRSHLRGCEPCQDFEQGIRHRRAAFAAFAPPLAPLAAAAVLQDVFGSGGASGGAGGVGGAVGATGVVSGGAPLVGPAALKVIAAALLTGAAGVGAYEAGTAIFAADPVASAPAAVSDTKTPSTATGQPDARREPSHAQRAASGPAARRGDGSGGLATARADSAGPGAAAGNDTPQAAGNEGSQAGNTAPPGEPSDPGGSGPPGGGSGGGPVDPPPPPPPPPGGGGSGAAPGTPAGHGGTPPGQGGVPPGQAGGSTPPGHLGNPGNGGGPH